MVSKNKIKHVLRTTSNINNLKKNDNDLEKVVWETEKRF